MCKFSEYTKQKLGNTIVYIARKKSNLSKTQLLILLYLMEERMALKYHIPFIGIPFEVWQIGPVAKDVFVDLSDSPYLLKNFGIMYMGNYCPFLTYGGTGTIVTYVLMGIMLSICRYQNTAPERKTAGSLFGIRRPVEKMKG